MAQLTQQNGRVAYRYSLVREGIFRGCAMRLWEGGSRCLKGEILLDGLYWGFGYMPLAVYSVGWANLEVKYVSQHDAEGEQFCPQSFSGHR
ncbi:MAG: hypothetical protein K1X48_08340 [Burkholderiaceae bacterium]|nr:hypothetical protein [Burkholderiaceae bacterium]